MKKSKVALVCLFFFVIALAATALIALTFTPQTSAGSWAKVCCGPQCGGYDYCIGDGGYTCCKVRMR